MASISWNEFSESPKVDLCVPEISDLTDLLEAALTYADAGWYVLPIDRDSKNAGSIVGKGWPEKSSKEHRQLEVWFRGQTTLGIALHIGKSGAIAFDVDNPSLVPYRLREWMLHKAVAFQSTRDNDPLRGHYLFAIQNGRNYGNSTGSLGKGWGEIRGRNGIIVVSPTRHSKSSEGGQYVWKRTGVLPYLPFELESKLPKNSLPSLSSANLAHTEEFLASYQEGVCIEVLEQRLIAYSGNFLIGSRHNAARDLLTLCLREAMAGLYPAKLVVEEVAHLFSTFKPESEWSSPQEFVDMVRWAVAQVETSPIDELSAIRAAYEMSTSSGAKKWIAGPK